MCNFISHIIIFIITMILIIIITILGINFINPKIFRPHPQLYLTQQQVYSQISLFAKKYPSIVTQNSCSQNSFIKSLTLKKGSSTLTAIIVCGMHARQFITVETCIQFIQKIIQSNQSNFYIQVFPMANEQRDEALNNGYCKRTNKNNVDLNRNYPILFQKTQKNPNSQIYSGLKAASQDSTKCIIKKLKSRVWDAFFDIHSGEFSIYIANYSASIRPKQLEQLANHLKKNYCPACRILSQNNNQYAGMLFEYASMIEKIPYSFAIEIYGGFISSRFGRLAKCFKIFNPNFALLLNHTKNIWSEGIINTLQNIRKLKK